MDERHVSLGCLGDSVTAVYEPEKKKEMNPTHRMLGELIVDALEIMKVTNEDSNTLEAKFNLPEKNLEVTLTITIDEKKES